MSYDYRKRGYLLPEGCKDLNDALELQEQERQFAEAKHLGKLPAESPPVIGHKVVPTHASVTEVATLLGETPVSIMAELLKLGFFTKPNYLLGFDTIAKVLRRYGFIAEKVA